MFQGPSISISLDFIFMAAAVLWAVLWMAAGGRFGDADDSEDAHDDLLGCTSQLATDGHHMSRRRSATMGKLKYLCESASQTAQAFNAGRHRALSRHTSFHNLCSTSAAGDDRRWRSALSAHPTGSRAENTFIGSHGDSDGGLQHQIDSVGPVADQTATQMRREFLRRIVSAPVILASSPLGASAAAPRCTDIESCREIGQQRFEEAEARRGPIVRLGDGVSYRESKRGGGTETVEEGDVVELKFQVLQGNGYYMYSLGYGKEPGNADLGETLRATIGKHDIPVAVERALVGARVGSVRTVEMPPRLGFETSDWKPAPTTFSGRQRIKGYKAVLFGNGLQPGYDAVLLFEVEVAKIRRRRGQVAFSGPQVRSTT